MSTQKSIVTCACFTGLGFLFYAFCTQCDGPTSGAPSQRNPGGVGENATLPQQSPAALTPTPSPTVLVRKQSRLLQTELVYNGGCEEVSGGRGVPGWKIVCGDWIPFEIEPRLRDAKSGSFIFRATGKLAVEEIRQDIDISYVWSGVGDEPLELTFSIRTSDYYRRGAGEDSEVVIEFIDGKGAKMGAALGYGPAWEKGWRNVYLRGEVPKFAKQIRLRLIAHRKRGTSNDAVFDNASLKLSLGKS